MSAKQVVVAYRAVDRAALRVDISPYAPAMRVASQTMAGVVVLLAAAVLGACSDPPPAGRVGSQRSTSTATTSPSMSDSPSMSPTTLTPEQEVEAAVRAYYAELTRAAQTNDTSRLKKLVHKNCPCYRAVTVIEDGARRGERTPDLEWRLQTVKVHDVVSSSAAAEVRFRVSDYKVIDGAGRTVERFPATNAHLDLSLTEQQKVWVVSNVFDLGG